MKLIVGLGNPGPDYDRTRHNIGFRALDLFLEHHREKAKKKVDEALTATCEINGESILFAKPQTFMNLSGRSVARLAKHCPAEPNEVLILHDEADLEEGRLQLKKGGGTGGHNGLESILSEWGESDFYRLRIGVGKNPDMELADYVLAPISAKILDPIAAKAADALEKILSLGPDCAMNEINSRQ